jgi:hypothetical protein
VADEIHLHCDTITSGPTCACLSLFPLCDVAFDVDNVIRNR